MTVYTEKYQAYEFPNKRDALKFIQQKAGNIPKSIKLLEYDKEHIYVMCPLSNSTLEITSDTEELQWLHSELTYGHWYTNF